MTETSKIELIKSLNELEKQTNEQLLRLDQPIKGEIYALVLMNAIFQFLKEKVSTPFNQILREAKVNFPTNARIQKIMPLDLGPPGRNFDVYDMPLVSQQFKEALTKIKELREYMQ